MKGLYGCFLFLFIVFSSAAQTITSTTTGGPWSSASTWTGGIIPQHDNSSSIVIAGPVNVPNGYSVTIDQLSINTSRTLTIDNGGTLIVINGAGDDLIFNTGFGTARLNVSGTLQMEEGSTIGNPSNTRLTILDGGLYRHNYTTTAGIVYAASWQSGSTLEFSGYTSNNSTPTGLNQTFHHFIWNCPGQLDFIDLNLSGSTTKVNGNFRVLGTNGAFLVLAQSSNYILDILGDFDVTGNSSIALNGFASITSSINVSGSFTYTSSAESWFAVDGATDMTVGGQVTINTASGSIDLSNNSGISTGSTSINIPSGFSFLSGSLANSADVTTCDLNFTNSTLYTSSGSAVYNGRINFDVSGILDLGTSNISGTGDLSVGSSGILKVGSVNTNGAIQLGTLAGNIRNSGSRLYSVGSTIEYNGTSGGQVIGNGHPTTAGVNITISNTSGVSIIAPTTLAGTINLAGGNLNINNSSLTITGNVTGTNRISIGAGGSLTLGGSSIIGTFPFTDGAQSFTNFTLNNSNGITFANNVTLTGALTLSNGILNFSNQTLTLNGTSSVSNGSLASNALSTLNIGGSGAFGDLVFAGTGNELNTLSYNRSSGTLNLASSVVITDLFELLNGAFTNSSGLSMANNSRIRRTNSGATLVGSAPVNDPGETFSVVYGGGALTTGLELPSDPSDLANLTVGGSLTKILDKSITVNGDLILGGGIFDPGNRTITMRGSFWRNNGGTLDSSDPNGLPTAPYGSTVNFTATSTITGTGTPAFENISVASTGNVTIESSVVNVAGNIQLNAASVFNPGTSTIVLTSPDNIDQTVSAGGKTFNNLTLNKAGGSDVLLSSALNVTALINIDSDNTDLNSNSNLTLVSNATSTASVGELLATRTISGDVHVQRYIASAGRFYRNISSPVLNPPVSDIIASGVTITGPFTGSSYPCAGCATNNPSFYYYNEAVAGVQNQGHVAYPPSGADAATTLLQEGRGYNLLVRSELGSPTMNLTGPINSGDTGLPVSYTTTSGGSNEDGWNFVGNPYPAAIDWDIIAGWSSKVDIQGNQILVWDPNKGTSGGYRSWNGTTGDLGSGVIASGQGFWIKLTGASTLSVTESAKTTSAASFLRKKTEDPSFIDIALTGNGGEDHSYVQLQKGASLFYDRYDGPKLVSPEGLNMMLLTDDNVKVGLQAVDDLVDETRIPFNIEGLAAGSYTFAVTKVGSFSEVPLMLLDAASNTLHDLNGEFTFAISEENRAASSDRFFLVIGRTSLVTDIEEDISKKISIFPNPVTTAMQVKVRSTELPTGSVIDSKGNVLGSITWAEGEDQSWLGTFNMEKESAGVYLTRLQIGKTVQVLKFVKYQ